MQQRDNTGQLKLMVFNCQEECSRHSSYKKEFTYVHNLSDCERSQLAPPVATTTYLCFKHIPSHIPL